MTGERDFLLHREDPVAVVGAIGLRRLHEGRLREP
jgi:hypothetical protein